MLGLLDTEDIRSYACEYQNTPTAPESFGERAALPSHPHYIHTRDKGIKQHSTADG